MATILYASTGRVRTVAPPSGKAWFTRSDIARLVGRPNRLVRVRLLKSSHEGRVFEVFVVRQRCAGEPLAPINVIATTMLEEARGKKTPPIRGNVWHGVTVIGGDDPGPPAFV